MIHDRNDAVKSFVRRRARLHAKEMPGTCRALHRGEPRAASRGDVIAEPESSSSSL
jgi:hypothetical protein